MSIADPSRTSLSPRRPGRVSPPPPAILHGLHEPLEGLRVLDENRTPLGAVLWQALRDVKLWAGTPQTDRASLFRPDCHLARRAAVAALPPDPALAVPLETFTSLLADPAAADPEGVALACQRAARWAEGHARPGTALAFAQAAALASPRSAAAALETGRLALEAGEVPRAESWFRRAIGLGRRGGDRVSLCQGCVYVAELHAARGELEVARVLYLRALRGARRGGLKEIRAQALHGLFRVEAARGKGPEAEAFARAALRAHRRRHPRLSRVAREVAAFWSERERHDLAAAALRLLLPQLRRPSERVPVLASLARACARAGDAEGYCEAAREAWEIVNDADGRAEHARPLMELAHGAVALREWEGAERAAQRALEAAVCSKDTGVERAAEALLASVWTSAGGMRWGAAPVAG